MLNIVLPIAGRGSRFLGAGYAIPKPLIPVHGVPMIELVIDNLRPSSDHRFIFLVLEEHLRQTGMERVLTLKAPGCRIIPVAAVTEGAACTVLLAEREINNADPIMIANCDQWVDFDVNGYLAKSNQADGMIMTMWADHPKWSYVLLDSQNQVREVVEKKVISNEATVGIYNFRRGENFVAGAQRMIAKNLRVNNEFYVAPVYNEIIGHGAKVGIWNVGRVHDGMYGLGTPEDLEIFLKLPISRRAAAYGTIPAATPS